MVSARNDFWLCLCCYLSCAALGVKLYGNSEYFQFTQDAFYKLIPCVIFYSVIASVILRFAFECRSYGIAVRASFLGFVCAIGILTAFHSPLRFNPFGTYIVLMTIFFCGEFLGIAYSNPQALSTDSFLVNHSKGLWIGEGVSWIEFFVESHLFPGMKTLSIIWIFGAFVCLFADVLRKIAITTAGLNFNHELQHEKGEEHALVVHGVYAKMRHPSYVGFIAFMVGMQIVLLNPVCAVVHMTLCWRFLKDRIYTEEVLLRKIYGSKYRDYQLKVPTGIPFIKGYVDQEQKLLQN